MITKQGQRWVSHGDALPQAAGTGVTRRVLACNSRLMCVENRFEQGAAGPGDAMLKTDGVIHGCTCLEAGVLLDIFTPMREDFLPEQN